MNSIMFLGPRGAGKTSLLKRLTGAPFDPLEAPTTDRKADCTWTSFAARTYELYVHGGNTAEFSIKLGNGTSMAVPYQVEADIYVAVYDGSRRESFKQMVEWVEYYKDSFCKTTLQPLIVVANHMDRIYPHMGYTAYSSFPPPPEVGQFMSLQESAASFLALSARDNQGIDALVDRIVSCTSDVSASIKQTHLKSFNGNNEKNNYPESSSS